MAFGGFFEPQNEPLEIREVAIVSAQEFDALFAPEIAPERAEDIVELPSIEPEEQAPRISECGGGVGADPRGAGSRAICSSGFCP